MGDEMKVKILGTGSIYSKSNCASLIIENNILIDIGPGTIKQLIKENYDLKEIDTIFESKSRQVQYVKKSGDK